jgi:GNAT superfamily N-acetyltransferase
VLPFTATALLGSDMQRVELESPLRWASSTDVTGIVRVINVAYAVERFFVAEDRVTVDLVVEYMGRSGASFIVAEALDGQVEGVAYVTVDAGQGYLGLLSVQPNSQGRGIARGLVEAVEEHCRQAGCDRIDLDVVDLRDELFPFYARFGFSPSGERPFPDPDKLTQPAKMITMTKPLGDIPG